MKKNLPWAACLLLAVSLLTGCAALLERSYSSSEPYADRYWDTGAEDTLRVESYQDLVNSLLLLIEEHAEEGVIRCYGEMGQFPSIMSARQEVRQETTLGSYLLKDLRLVYETGTSYSTVTCHITYREDAEDVDAIMTLSDSQSLVDLLRLTVREEREKLTARFSYDMPQEDVRAAVESFWQELCLAEMEELQAAEAAAGVPGEELTPDEPGDLQESEEEQTPGNGGEPLEGSPAEEPPAPSGEEEQQETAEAPTESEESPIEYPPCPWKVKFYPNKETAEIVEVLISR